jgi:DNA-binding CsgD family transcriptional regulator
MGRLQQRDFGRLLEFVRRSYALCDVDDLVTHLLAFLPQLIPAEAVTYTDIDPLAAKSRSWVNPPELGTPTNNRLFEAHVRDHPVLTHNVRTGDGQALMISDFCSRQEFQVRGLYNELYRPVGIEDDLCFTVLCQPRHTIGIGLHRERWGFLERDRLLANLLRPHVVQAWRNVRKMASIRTRVHLLSAVMDDFDFGVIVLNTEGRIRLINSRARQCVTQYFGISHGLDQHLPEDLQRVVRYQEEQLSGPHVPRPRAPFVIEKHEGRLEVRVLSLSGQTLLLLEEHSHTLDTRNLQELGLTPRESEVLAWVAQGKANAEIGSIIDVAPRTVKKHLEHIFAKLGVETRTAAAAVALDKMRSFTPAA